MVGGDHGGGGRGDGFGELVEVGLQQRVCEVYGLVRDLARGSQRGRGLPRELTHCFLLVRYPGMFEKLC